MPLKSKKELNKYNLPIPLSFYLRVLLLRCWFFTNLSRGSSSIDPRYKYVTPERFTSSVAFALSLYLRPIYITYIVYVKSFILSMIILYYFCFIIWYYFFSCLSSFTSEFISPKKKSLTKSNSSTLSKY